MKETLIDELIKKWEYETSHKLKESQRSVVRELAFSKIDDFISDMLLKYAAAENQKQRYEEMC